MKRKKWTPKEDVTESDLKFREKRRWQIALRRYILDKNPCTAYAPYFALDIKHFRNWIELQFEDDLNWENFGSAWQLDHVIPVAYFDFALEADLRLCWNFINIRVDRTNDAKMTGGVDILAARSFYESLYNSTGYNVCEDMLKKIAELESARSANPVLEEYMKENIDYLQALTLFASQEFTKLNEGESFSNIILEKEIIKKFGA